MKHFLTTFLLSLSVGIFAQGIKLKTVDLDIASSELIIFNMDSLISQQDSLKIASKWNGKSLRFESNIEALDYQDQAKVVVSSFSLDATTQCFAIFELNAKTMEFVETSEKGINFIHTNSFQYILIDKSACNKGLEPTIILALVDLMELGPKLKTMDQVVSRLQHNEWLREQDQVFVDINDISKVYRYQSELNKIGVKNVQFLNEDTDFNAWSKSEIKQSTFIDRRKVDIKGQTYIITLFLDIGKGLQFIVAEKEAKRSTPLIGKPYLEFLYQVGPIKMNTPLVDQNLEIKVPARQ